ncbi:MAG: transposase [Acidobacteriota bacterium]
MPSDIWTTPWVVHCQHAGRGQKVLDYLGRYIFRVAIANSALEQIQDGRVTFRYRDNRTQRLRRVTLSGIECLQRFLQHVLPRGGTKVRYSAFGVRPADANSIAPARFSPPRHQLPSSRCPSCRRRDRPSPSRRRCAVLSVERES